MTQTPLPENFGPNTPYRVSGKLLNRIDGAINSGSNNYGQSNLSGFVGNGLDARVPQPEFRMGVISVTKITNLCGNPSDAFETYLPPCGRLGKYVGVFRWWNHTTAKWDTDDAEHPIDTGAYHDGRGEQYGPAPALLKGDTLPGYFDPSRGMLVAVPGLWDQPPSIDTNRIGGPLELPINHGSGPAGFVIWPEVYDTEYKRWFRFTDRDIVIPAFESDGSTEAAEASGSSFVAVPMRHGSAIRLRGYYKPLSIFTEAQPRLVIAGFRAMPLGRIHRSVATNAELTESERPVGAVFDRMAVTATTLSRPRDTPFWQLANYQAVQGFLSEVPPRGGGYSTSEATAFDIAQAQATGGGGSDSALVMLCQGGGEGWNVLLWWHAKVDYGEMSSSSKSSTSSSSTSTSSSSSSSSTSSTSSTSSSSTSSTSSTSSSLSSESSSNSISTSSVSRSSMSDSSSSSYDCFTVVSRAEFDEVACTFTVCYREICLPKGSGLLVGGETC